MKTERGLTCYSGLFGGTGTPLLRGMSGPMRHSDTCVGGTSTHTDEAQCSYIYEIQLAYEVQLHLRETATLTK